MTVHAPIPPRIVKCLPLLASPVDGEVVATAKAITRQLGAAGLDWHAIVSALESPSNEPPPQPTRRTPSAPANPTTGPRYSDWRETWAHRHRPRLYTEAQERAQRLQVMFLRANPARLAETERAFVADVASRIGSLSYAEADHLVCLVDRVEMEAGMQ